MVTTAFCSVVFQFELVLAIHQQLTHTAMGCGMFSPMCIWGTEGVWCAKCYNEGQEGVVRG